MDKDNTRHIEQLCASIEHKNAELYGSSSDDKNKLYKPRDKNGTGCELLNLLLRRIRVPDGRKTISQQLGLDE